MVEIKKSNYYNYIFYRKLYNKIGYYHDNRFGADSEFIKRLGLNGYKVYQDKHAIFYNAYTTNGKNLTGKKIKKQKSLLIKARKKVIKSPQILSDPDKQREQEKRRQERQKRKDQVLESISKNKRISKNQIKRDAEKEKKSLTEVQS